MSQSETRKKSRQQLAINDFLQLQHFAHLHIGKLDGDQLVLTQLAPSPKTTTIQEVTLLDLSLLMGKFGMLQTNKKDEAFRLIQMILDSNAYIKELNLGDVNLLPEKYVQIIRTQYSNIKITGDTPILSTTHFESESADFKSPAFRNVFFERSQPKNNRQLPSQSKNEAAAATTQPHQFTILTEKGKFFTSTNSKSSESRDNYAAVTIRIANHHFSEGLELEDVVPSIGSIKPSSH